MLRCVTVRTLDRTLSPAQQAAVSAEGNALVDAGPGTGKTHVIVARIRHLAREVEPRRILVLTFSRRAVGELRERIARETGVACEVRTFHGFASRLLEADGPRFTSRRLLDSLSESLLLDTALARARFPTLPRSATSSERFRADFERFVADVRRAATPAVRSLRAGATPRLRDLLGAYDELLALRDTLGASDIDDLIARASEALEDRASAASVWLDRRYEHVLVDEFQDVDATQLALLGRLEATLFAVGDASQAIYGFRGALTNVIETAVKRFALQRFVLAESRRCPQRICDLAAATPLLKTTPLTSLRESPGSVTAQAARTTLDEAALISDRVEDALAAGLAPERIAVLLRAMRPLGPALEAELRSRGVRVAGGGPDAFLADQNVETVRLGLRLLAEPSERERWVAFLSSPAVGFDRLRVSIALRGRAVASIREGCDVVAGGLPVAASRPPSATCDLAGVTKALKFADEAFHANDIGRAARRLVNGLGLVVSAAHDNSGFSEARARLGRLGRVIDALTAARRNLAALGEPAHSTAVLHVFEKRIEAVAAEETPDENVPGVRLLSIHGAKGLEFDLVIIGDAVEGRFPAPPRRSSLLNEDALEIARATGVDLAQARNDSSLREEAALWYVAVTRTRDALFVTYASHGADGAPQRPSRFLPAEFHPPKSVAPYERRLERPEDLAREAGDEAVLARLSTAVAGSPTLAAILEEGAGAFAPLPERPVIYAREPGVSAAEDWFHCPRRFYYGRVLGLRDEPGETAKLGTALHAILASFHEEFADFTEVREDDVILWVAKLRELRKAEWLASPFEPAAKNVATAQFADRVLAAYATSLAVDARRRPFTVLACERPIESRYGSFGVRGKVDRVDRVRAGGDLILRDYKSGRRHTPFQKTLEKTLKTETGEPIAGRVAEYFRPQIALYRRGAEGEFGGRVGALEYVYLNGVKDDDEEPIAYDALAIDETTEAQLAAIDAALERDFLAPFARGVYGPIATATDVEKTCKFCNFKVICPGPES
jgi:superfamily I DNA/RNA helicase